MLTSITNVHDEFFKLFRPQIILSDSSVIPVRYGRESRDNHTEMKLENYPQVVLLDFQPEFDPDWNQNYFVRVDGFRDSYGEGIIDKGYLFKEPIRFIFRYDVSVYIKDPLKKWMVQEYFYGRFARMGSFIFNKLTVETTQQDASVGDVVSYVVTPREIPRTDGVFEMNYEFALKPMIAIQMEEDVELLQQLNIIDKTSNENLAIIE